MTNNREMTMTMNGSAIEVDDMPPVDVTAEAPAIQLRRLSRETFVVPIEGVTPLIAHRWSEKSREIMLAAQQTSARAKKEAKDPVALFNAARYLMPDGRDGFPSSAFKAAIVDATRLFDKSLTKVLVKQTVTVYAADGSELVPLELDGPPRMREDTPRNSNGGTDLRYRPEYSPWRATLYVSCVDGQFDHESILALVDAAGIGGVGEWRPTSPKSSTGSFGTFRVVES